jgi:hypothetical protein
VEYAITAVQNAAAAVGIQCAEGIVVACEKRVSSKLLAPSKTSEKTYKLDEHVRARPSHGGGPMRRGRQEPPRHLLAARGAVSSGHPCLHPLPLASSLLICLLARGICRQVFAAVAGLTSDANTLVNYARLAAQRYRLTYGEEQPVEALVQLREW